MNPSLDSPLRGRSTLDLMSNDSLNQATTTAPEIIRRYLAAADAQDSAALAECFTTDGSVVDEEQTYVGRDAIRGWRDLIAGKFTYTTKVTGSEPGGPDTYRVRVHVEGDFPGGQADLTYSFELRDGLIAALHIG
jgi:ketosteroid isomerase-like protein